MRSRRVRTIALTIALGVGVIVALWFVIVVLPGWAVDPDAARMTAVERQHAESTVRGDAFKAIGLLVVVITVQRYFLEKDKQRLEREKQRLDSDKYLTGQFDTATTHLSAAEVNERANGVSTLARLMAVSPTDHMPGIYALCDLLRHYAVPGEWKRLPSDLAAAVRTLRNRPDRPETEPLDLIGVYLPGSDWRGARLRGVRFADPDGAADSTSIGGSRSGGASSGRGGTVASTGMKSGYGGSTAGSVGANLPGAGRAAAPNSTSGAGEASVAALAGANFAGADLREARCAGIDFTGAVLRGANLSDADFTAANLGGADLTGADATAARFTNALLGNADLRGARLCGADLRRARLGGVLLGTAPDAPDSVTDLSGANLDEAVLEGVDLRDVRGLTDAAIRTAIVDSKTNLPAGVRHPRLTADE